ncbi:DUF2752 domain-containing protein [bacterium]|nr:MAG: DUF2752 domain-containing protein [bacterium]
MAKRILADNFEIIVWACALAWLALSDPVGGGHFTLCPLGNLGMDFCPGCGLGRAVSCAIHGQWAESFHSHLLGIPAIVILTARIAALARNAFKRYTRTAHYTNSQKEPVCPTSCS